jgi:hypothetical protein
MRRESESGRRKGIATLLGCLGLASLIALMNGGLADAGKPEKPPPEGGVVYFHAGGCWRMNPDGSGKTPVLDNCPEHAEPSQYLHGGLRWFLIFLEIEGDTYPDGEVRRELCAVNELGILVQLGEDPTLQPLLLDTQGVYNAHPRWALGDTRVSYLARRWGVDPETGEWSIDPETGDPVVTEVGLYFIDLIADISEAPPASFPLRVPVELPTVVHSSSPWNGYPAPRVYGLDWSPDATRVVYSSDTIFVADTTTGETTDLAIPGAPVRWSPDGATLLLRSDPGSLWTFAPDGSDLIEIVTRSKKSYPIYAYWSPSGANVVYYEETPLSSPPGNWGFKGDILRVQADGSGETNLTRDIDGTPVPLGWRLDEEAP